MAFKLDQIKTDLLAALGTIKTTNEWATGKNYLTNIGNFIETWEVHPVPQENNDEFILEDPVIEKIPEDEPMDHHKFAYIFSIKAFQAKGDSSIAEIRKIRMDLVHCIGKLSIASLIKYKDTVFEIPRLEIQVKEENRIVAGLICVLRVTFADDPFFMIEEF